MAGGPISKDLIDALLTAALTWHNPVNPGGFFFQEFYSQRSHRFGWDDASVAGQILWRNAWEFTVAPYTEEACPPYEFERYPGAPDAKIVLDLISHYVYHAGFLADDYPGSAVDSFLVAIQAAAIKNLSGPTMVGLDPGDRSAFTRKVDPTGLD